jgi:predicted nucleic acid-binding protein
MYLVDTSVWINYLRGRPSRSVHSLTQILQARVPFGITGVIYQEILQGSASEADFNKLREYFSSQRFFHPRDVLGTYESAAHLYFSCRQKGVTIRSTLDCLIAQIAVEHDLILLHADRDYEKIQSIQPALKLQGESGSDPL